MWIATCTPASSATRRQASIAAGVEPQSSCSLKPPTPARACSRIPSPETVLPLPSSSTLTGWTSIASSISRIAHGDGVQVVARVPSAGPVPPPISVVIPAATASSTICGQMKCTCPSIPPAVRIRPSPAMISVVGPISRFGSTPSITSGLPAFPKALMRPARMPTSHLTMPQ